MRSRTKRPGFGPGTKEKGPEKDNPSHPPISRKVRQEKPGLNLFHPNRASATIPSPEGIIIVFPIILRFTSPPHSLTSLTDGNISGTALRGSTGGPDGAARGNNSSFFPIPPFLSLGTKPQEKQDKMMLTLPKGRSIFMLNGQFEIGWKIDLGYKTHLEERRLGSRAEGLSFIEGERVPGF